MNKEFLQYYEHELKRLRENGNEFALGNPKIAGKLNINEFTCEDPYVERLLEGFSYLSARVHQKIDAGYPRLSQALFDNLFPGYLMPIPSMGIVRFDPDTENPSFVDGVQIKRGSSFRSISARGFNSCQFKTTHDIILHPVGIEDAKYYTDDMGEIKVDYSINSRSCLCLELNTLKNYKFSDLNMDSIEIYLRNSSHLVNLDIFELMLEGCRKIIVQPKDRRRIAGQTVLSNSKSDLISPVGLEKEQGLFPYNPKTFEGYRLLRKYFAMPKSFMFLKVGGLGDALKRMDVDKINIIFIFDREIKSLRGSVKRSSFSMYCTPVINLFEKTLSRIHPDNNKSEFHIVGERTEPQDFEVIKVNSVKGYKSADNKGQVFRPMYSASGFFENRELNKAYYSINRVPRTLTEYENDHGTRSQYVGTESYIALVDQDNAPYNGNIADIEIKALCSNRDLPLLIPAGSDYTDFTFGSDVPVKSIKFIHGPTDPYCRHIFNSQWEVINHISLNYLSLQDENGEKTGEILRNILNLYSISELQKKFIKGLKTVKVRPSSQKFSRDGMFTTLNGIDIEILFNDSGASGDDFFLLGMILDRYFEYAAPINSFTRTTLKTEKRGRVAKWAARTGTFQMI